MSRKRRGAAVEATAVAETETPIAENAEQEAAAVDAPASTVLLTFTGGNDDEFRHGEYLFTRGTSQTVPAEIAAAIEAGPFGSWFESAETAQTEQTAN